MVVRGVVFNVNRMMLAVVVIALDPTAVFVGMLLWVGRIG
jgi:hypothetical protein